MLNGPLKIKRQTKNSTPFLQGIFLRLIIKLFSKKKDLRPGQLPQLYWEFLQKKLKIWLLHQPTSQILTKQTDF